MSVAERWARTAEQIDLMQAARFDGGVCSWCGRRLGEHETAYVERFLVGDRRAGQRNNGKHHALAWAPVGAECASPSLLEETEGQAPEACAGCGRGVFRRPTRAAQKRITCSRYCARHPRDTEALKRRPASGDAPDGVRTLTAEMRLRLAEAKTHGGLCVWCGRTLADDEAVHLERFLVEMRKVRATDARPSPTYVTAPIGIECLPPESLHDGRWLPIEPCAGCDRPVYHRARRANRRQSLCSRKCAWLALKRGR
jgi:hypothetical protein